MSEELHVNPEYPAELPYRRVLDHGFVALVDVMGNDASIVQAARVSYGKGTKTVRGDKALISYLMRHRHCYDAQTEVLTDRGFVRWPLVTDGMRLAVWDDVRGTLCYEYAAYVTRHAYEGPMARVEHAGVDLLVTPDHKMYVAPAEGGPFRLVAASALGRRPMRYRKCAPLRAPAWGGGDFPSFIDRRAVLGLVGLYLGAGRAAESDALELGAEAPAALLEELAARAGWTLDGRTLRVRGLGHLFRQTFHTDGVKRLPPWVLGLGREDAADVLDGLLACRGAAPDVGDPALADQVQVLALHAGRCLDRAGASALTPAEAEPAAAASLVGGHAGEVYCAHTRTGILVVRRRGRVALSGNTTPFEMVEFKFLLRLPVFIARQWIRHRTACLAGDTLLGFDASLTIAELHRLWHEDRPPAMPLRMCNERTGAIEHTHVRDVWQSGMKPVYRVTLENGYRIKMTRDHRCLTERGWKTLGEATDLRRSADGRVAWSAAAPAFAVNGVATASRPRLMRAWSRVRSIEYVGEEMTYDLEVSGPYHNFVANGFVVHNSVNEYSARYSVVPDRFFVPPLGAISPQDHVNRQGRADVVAELAAALPGRDEPCAFVKGQQAVLVRAGKGISPAALLVPEHRAAWLGEDLLPAESYLRCADLLLERFPERKAGLERVQNEFRENNERCYRLYEAMIGQGIAREVARCVLPLTMYTEWYWKIDLHNLFHFLKLRMDAHAQLEIRAFAEAMATFVKPHVPYAWDAFESDNLEGTFLSRPEKDALRPAGEDAQREVLGTLWEQGYRQRRLKEVCRKLGFAEGLVDEMWPPAPKDS